MKDINLMPDKAKAVPSPKEDSTKMKGVSVKAVIITASALVLIFASILTPKVCVKVLEGTSSKLQAEIQSDKYTEVKNVNQQIATIESNVSRKREVIDNITSDPLLTTDILNFVQQTAPEGVTIDSLLCGDNSLSITGFAKDSTAVAEYISNITRTDAFVDYTSKATFSYDKANVKLAFKIELSQNNQGV